MNAVKLRGSLPFNPGCILKASAIRDKPHLDLKSKHHSGLSPVSFFFDNENYHTLPVPRYSHIKYLFIGLAKYQLMTACNDETGQYGASPELNYRRMVLLLFLSSR